MPSSQHLATAFGFAGVLANICWPLMRERRHLLAGQVLACTLMLTHFALLGAYTGATIMGVAGIQAAMAIPLERKPRFKYLYLASLALTPVVCIATWQGAQSVFSSLALAIVCVANFQLNQVRQRALLVTAIVVWFAHNLMVASIPGIVSNVLAFVVSTRMLVITARAARNSRLEVA
ncbi:MAG: YgjV family protein [Rhodoferax sp.]|nr:YgjV family protein [Rhodoferax sp.]MDP3655228.1 YgjV family protein [Rhodoferax sp.]